MSAPDPFRGGARPDPGRWRLAPVHWILVCAGIAVWGLALRGGVCLLFH